LDTQAVIVAGAGVARMYGADITAVPEGGNMARTSSISVEEVARFDALAEQWWNPDGPMRPLHRMNPARIAWIEERVRRRYGNRSTTILDVGCGAGLAAEALARHGHSVLGLDAAAGPIAAAEAHAAAQERAQGRKLSLGYRVGAAEDLLAEPVRFEVVTALEIIEHVADVPGFLSTLAGLLVPGGLLFISTLNRTPWAYLAAKAGAEYLLRWLPVGTHDWQKFVTPAELGTGLRETGLRLSDSAGLSPRPILGGWHATRDLSVNYIVMAENG
jgi:2-polyprenyl-6-hydroxyphenyl methylase/3-demethylubiquinone-9 3-methyltransferase